MDNEEKGKRKGKEGEQEGRMDEVDIKQLLEMPKSPSKPCQYLGRRCKRRQRKEEGIGRRVRDKNR